MKLKAGRRVLVGARPATVASAGEDASLVHFVDERGLVVDWGIVPNAEIERVPVGMPQG